MYISTTGLILRETDYKESSRMLTILTASDGKLSVSAKGVKRKGSRVAAASQLLTYSELTLYSGKAGWTLTEARSIEEFRGLRDDYSLLVLGSYFAELLETVSDEDTPDPAILSLGLNGLYALSEKLCPEKQIKAAFELRLMCLAGFEPVLDACSACMESNPKEPVFNPVGGVLRCNSCGPSGPENVLKLSAGSLAAMRHIVSADSKKIFAFSLGKAVLAELGAACEAYVRVQLDREFRTLDAYKSASRLGTALETE